MKKLEARHFAFLGLFVVVTLAMLLNIKLEMKVSPYTQSLYDYIESLPEGSTLIVSFDHEASSLPEIRPIATAVLRHAFRKKHKLQEHVVMRGIKPRKAKQLFTDPRQIARYFKLAKQAPVPIFVVYRQLAGRTPPPSKPIDFKEAYVAEGRYQFTVERAEIFKKNGSAEWDPVGDSRPDPYVELWVGQKVKGGKLAAKSKNLFFKTKVKDDKLKPTWMQHKSVNLYGGETIRVEIWDDDASGRDSIGKCNLPRIKRDKGEFELPCGGANLIKIHYEKQ